MATPPEKRSPFAEAAIWTSRITTVVLEMILPGLAGHWLDRRFGTGFLVLLGFAFGLTAGMWHLLVMTDAFGQKDSEKKPDEKDRQK